MARPIHRGPERRIRERRSGKDRRKEQLKPVEGKYPRVTGLTPRKPFYDYFPEQRSGKERRSGKDRRKKQ